MGFTQTVIEPVDTGEHPGVQWSMKTGDMYLHHTNTIHRSGPHSTAKSRRRFAIDPGHSLAKRDEAGRARCQAGLRKLHEQHQ